jgi:hypothetical protein
MEGSWALPHGEFGLDVIALIGTLRFCDHRSVPEIHQALLARGMRIAERTVLNLLQRYEELVAVRLADTERLTHLRCRSKEASFWPSMGYNLMSAHASFVDHPRLLIRGDFVGAPAPQ